MRREGLITEHDVEDEGRAKIQPPHSIETHFSWIRTRMGAERTLEAWVRTAVSLIGFGFTIVQFFERLNSMEGFKAAKSPFLARYVGLILIAVGTLGLVVAIWQYQTLVQYLHSEPFRDIAQVKEVPGSATVYIAVILCLVGVFAFVAVVTRSG